MKTAFRTIFVNTMIPLMRVVDLIMPEFFMMIWTTWVMPSKRYENDTILR